MPPVGDHAAEARATVDALYRGESRRVLSTLIRLLRDFDLAEEALHDAFAAALAQWPVDGVPANPRAWLVSAGRFRAVDAVRRRVRFDASLAEVAARLSHARPPPEPDEVEDDRLRLVFICCHPELPVESQIALTLREACGLTTEEIARAFLTAPATLAQRIVRAKARLRELGTPFDVPAGDEVPARLDAVLKVLYLVYNEGHTATSGASLTRADLSAEAIRLARTVHDLLPEPEAGGLLALMLLCESRRAARTTAAGDLVLLEDQDRSLWDAALIEEGCRRVEAALRSRRFGPYTLQAAIAAVHAEATCAEATDWEQIVGLYDVLARTDPSPVVRLNRAVAVAFRDGPDVGLRQIDRILADGELDGYLPALVARADLLRRLGRRTEAAAAFRAALGLVRQEPERRFFERRIAELGPAA